MWPSEIWSASNVPPVQFPVIDASSVLRCYLGFELPKYLTAELFPLSWQPLFQCWSILSAQVGTCVRSVAENHSPSISVSICPITLLPEQASVHALLMSSLQASHSPAESSTGPSTQQGGSSSLYCIPGLEAQYMAQTTHSSGRFSACVTSLFLWAPSAGYSSQTNYFSSLLLYLYLSYNLGCTRIFLLVSSSFSVRIVPHVDVCLMCFDG